MDSGRRQMGVEKGMLLNHRPAMRMELLLVLRDSDQRMANIS